MRPIHLPNYVSRRLQIAEFRRREAVGLPRYKSSFIFIIERNVRTFHHRWQINGDVYECNACSSSCNARSAYSKHWHQEEHDLPPQRRRWREIVQPRPVRLTAHLGAILGAAQRLQLQHIVEHNIEHFILCNHRGANGAKEFLLEAGMHAVPQLLRLLFHACDEVYVRLGFYARVRERSDLLFQSGELPVRHHHDVPESVDVLFLMLLERIETYAKQAHDYSVLRISIQVRRIKRRPFGVKSDEDVTFAALWKLPLQYRVKHATAPRAFNAQQWREQSLELRSNANLYGFRECRLTQELYVLPYQYGGRARAATGATIPNFIMLCNVAGELQYLLPISSMHRFLRQEDDGDRVYTCRQCCANFAQRSKYVLHQMLQCGRGFEVLKVPSDCVEIYERCLSMECDEYRWPLYGIMRGAKK